MNIAILLAGRISEFPPAINLARVLVSLGHHVTVLANEIGNTFSDSAYNGSIDVIELGKRKTKSDKIKQLYQTRVKLRDYISHSSSSVDLFWCMTDLTAREAGAALLDKKYVMNISELVEYVPLYTSRPMPFHSKMTIKLARNASAVVCPEYNRAQIQRVWWDLPRPPFILPNKPADLGSISFRDEDADVRRAFEMEQRKVLLYQGVFSPDRSFAAYPKALETLGNDYCLYLMGKAIGAQAQQEVQQLANENEQIVLVDFVPAPYHLSFTSYGYIGLLPYKPAKGGRCSSLNALYCAPNKVWEYSRIGLPMIGSDVPGLRSLFDASGSGISIDMDNSSSIVEAVRAIETDYSMYQKNSLCLYESCDLSSIVQKIIDCVML